MATQKDADLVTARTWLNSVDTQDRAFGRRESDALDAGVLAYRVVDAFGKSGGSRADREKVLAGAILSFAQRLYAQDRETLRSELTYAKQCERERAEETISKAVAAAHTALDGVWHKPR